MSEPKVRIIVRDRPRPEPPLLRGARGIRAATPVALLVALPLAAAAGDRITSAMEFLWFAETAIELVAVAFATALISAAAVHLEGLQRPTARDHRRHAALLYAALAGIVLATLYLGITGSALRSWDPTHLPALFVMACASNGAVLWLARGWRAPGTLFGIRWERKIE
jgi:hypothetical protein